MEKYPVNICEVRWKTLPAQTFSTRIYLCCGLFKNPACYQNHRRTCPDNCRTSQLQTGHFLTDWHESNSQKHTCATQQLGLEKCSTNWTQTYPNSDLLRVVSKQISGDLDRYCMTFLYWFPSSEIPVRGFRGWWCQFGVICCTAFSLWIKTSLQWTLSLCLLWSDCRLIRSSWQKWPLSAHEKIWIFYLHGLPYVQRGSMNFQLYLQKPLCEAPAIHLSDCPQAVVLCVAVLHTKLL